MDSKIEIKNLIDDFYGIISGKTTEKRDWNRFKNLFYPNAHLMSMSYNSDNKCSSIPKNVDTYVSILSNLLEEVDFYEYGLNYEIEIYGNIARVYSEYEAKNNKEDKNFIKKGINLVQAINDGQSWKILNMFWDTEKLK